MLLDFHLVCWQDYFLNLFTLTTSSLSMVFHCAPNCSVYGFFFLFLFFFIFPCVLWEKAIDVFFPMLSI